MNTSRIPTPYAITFDGMLEWFSEMSVRDLLFHPDDAPGEIITIATGEKMFSDAECKKLDGIISNMFEEFGDAVYEAAYPIFMKRMGLQLDA
ncbi:MAG: hypothetical protein ACOYMG_22460 [Candidatus Methylumidiphilus sp.]